MNQTMHAVGAAMLTPDWKVKALFERKEYFQTARAMGFSKQQAEDVLQSSIDEAVTSSRSIYAIARIRLIQNA